MYKDTKLEINVKAINPEVFITGATYYSYDVESGRFLIHLKKDQVDFSIPEGTDLKMTLIKLSDNTKYIVVPEIEDRVRGVISLVIPKILLGYVGGVRAGIFIKPPNTQSVHGGYFTFSMALSDIDDDNEEMVEYYNQLFEDLVINFEKDVNELMTDAEQHAEGKIIEYDKKFVEVEEKVSSMENQASNMEVKQDEILKKIEENDVPTKAESSANVIYQVIGKEKVRLTFTLDLNSASSVAFSAGYSSLLPITNTAWRQLTDEQLQTVLALDGSIFVSRDLANNYRKQVRIQWNFLPFIKAELGDEYFIDKGIVDDTEILNHLKEVIIEDEANIWGFGVGGLVNKLNMSVLNKQNQWFDPVFNTDATVSKLTRSGDFKSFVSDTGTLEYIVYPEPTASNSYSTVNIDYMNFKFSIDVSMNEHIKALIATDRGENIATQEEAEKGNTDEKVMTPAKTKVSINYEANEGLNKELDGNILPYSYRDNRYQSNLNWIAHRGNNIEYPENSLPAFQNVKRHWGIETDIHLTKDGKWVVMHDETVDRTTNGTGKITEMTLEEFRALRIDVGSNIDVMTDKEKIPPILEEFLYVCKENNRVPVIEFKSSSNYSNEQLLSFKEIVVKYGFQRNLVLISFSLPTLQQLRKLFPDVMLHYLFNGTLNSSVVDTAGDSLGYPCALSVNFNNSGLNEEIVSYSHKKNIEIGVWTVPDASFDAMKALLVDYITTNSLSGNLRYQALELQNGFTNNVDGGRIKESYVEEIGGGKIHVSFNVGNGVTTHNLAIAKLPDWAIPMYRQYPKCTVRTATGVDLGTFDVNGRLVPGSATAGTLGVGLNWENKNSWVSGETIYKI